MAGKTRKVGGKKKGTRKLNAYFKKMIGARKKDLDHFMHGGNKYVKMVGPTGMTMYKKG